MKNMTRALKALEQYEEKADKDFKIGIWEEFLEKIKEIDSETTDIAIQDGLEQTWLALVALELLIGHKEEA
nr:MAG TPA: hypothetical protein [Caudoviricetes sp.]